MQEKGITYNNNNYVCVCVTLEHTWLPVPVEMQLDLCRYTSLCSIQTVLFYALIVLHSGCMYDLYHVRGHSYYAVGMLMWYAKGLKAMKGIHTSHEFCFVEVWHVLCSKNFPESTQGAYECMGSDTRQESRIAYCVRAVRWQATKYIALFNEWHTCRMFVPTWWAVLTHGWIC